MTMWGHTSEFIKGTKTVQSILMSCTPSLWRLACILRCYFLGAWEQF